jgi:nucleoside-diphosphate-sugar epimerase
MARKMILVAGAQGIIGRAVIEHCETIADVEVIGLGRRKPDYGPRARFISVDLLDPASCESQLGDLRTVTHLVFAAWTAGPTRAEEVGPNLAMLRNLMEVLGLVAPDLRHVTLLQGAKAYGSHLGSFMTPAREDDPRHMPPNFYYDQEDYLTTLQRCSRWTWTIFRPTVVYGFAAGNPMNMTTVIGVYAAISQALGLPLRYPGNETAYGVLNQAVSAALIACAILWAGDTERAANEAYNITNGDMFRWSRMWPHIAGRFGIEVSPPQRIPLTEFMSDKAELWADIAGRHNLAPIPFADLVAWPFGEFILNRQFDHLLDSTKLRDHGFDGYADSFRMFDRQIDLLRHHRVIPA